MGSLQLTSTEIAEPIKRKIMKTTTALLLLSLIAISSGFPTYEEDYAQYLAEKKAYEAEYEEYKEEYPDDDDDYLDRLFAGKIPGKIGFIKEGIERVDQLCTGREGNCKV